MKEKKRREKEVRRSIEDKTLERDCQNKWTFVQRMWANKSKKACVV